MESEILNSLANFDRYKRFPVLLPFVGDSYDDINHKKLLLIGESHYLPSYSTIHHSYDNWYMSNENDLNEEERDWIFTSNLVKFLCGKLYKKINQLLMDVVQSSNSENSIENIAYYNYFQRPAFERKSFKEVCTQQDQEIAIITFRHILDVLKPDLIIFLSKYSIDSAEKYKIWEMTKHRNISYTYTNHPMSIHWNRAVRKNFFNGLTSKEHFFHFLDKNNTSMLAFTLSL